MAAQTNTANDLNFLQGGGEMGERIRQFDWSGATLGDPEYWPGVLRNTVRRQTKTNNIITSALAIMVLVLKQNMLTRSLIFFSDCTERLNTREPVLV